LNSEIKTHLKITNKSDMKQAFKIKCTRNDLFKIRPATGILDYNQTSNITLTYKPNGEVPENDKHHFGVYHIPAPEGCTCEGAWSEHYGPPQGEFRLKINLTKINRSGFRFNLKKRNSFTKTRDVMREPVRLAVSSLLSPHTFARTMSCVIALYLTKIK
uniref:Major sperm protein n=1 Tax=Heligmosomoides polygyrus TaxID=6339 RepID=A0A183FH72_HELPZ